MRAIQVLASLGALILATAAMAGVARAQDTQAAVDTQQDTQGQNAQGAARVSVMQGSVSMQRGDSGTWEALTVNAPLFAGDTISTGGNSRAEVQLDYANVVRLGSNSTVKIANLDRNTIQVQVAGGLVNFDVLQQDQAQAEIDTPSVAVHPQGNGRYRVEVDPNDQTLVTVEQGEANVSTPQGSTTVEAGQLITVQGIDNPQYKVSQAPAEDSWDQWNQDRDRVIADSGVWQHTDRYYTGAQDLNSYGQWVNIPGYGQVWQPYDQANNWAPYQDGTWTWEPCYGWTWVSYEPWGWAPYHYGRWFLYDSDWCWWPGPVYAYPDYYPIWSPAYVSFFGWGYGGGFGFGFGFGNVGWLPIGPCDPFFPWWGGGRSLIVFNFNNFDRGREFGRYGGWSPLYRGNGYSNFGSVMANARLRGGISWMRASQFGRGPVPRGNRGINAATFQQARMFSGRVPVVPTRQSLRFTNRDPGPGTIRNNRVMNQRFFTSGHSTSARQTPFRTQQADMQRTLVNFRTHGGAKATATGQPFGVNSRGNFGATGRATTPFGTNPRGPAQPTVRTGASGNATGGRGNGWHAFGNAGPGARGNVGPASRGNVGQAPRGNGSGMRFGAPAQPRGNAGSRAPFNAGPSRPAQAPAQRQGGWRPFTPSAHPAQPAGRPTGGGHGQQHQGFTGFTSGSEQPRNTPPARGSGSAPAARPGGWRPFTSSSQPPAQGGGWRQSGRQPLNLRQPIVQRPSSPPAQSGAPRGSSGNFHSFSNNGGGGGPAPNYHAPAAPRGGGYRSFSGGGSAPSYHPPAAPRGGGYGGYGGGGSAPSYHPPAAPRGGGGFGGYGGGGRAPSYHAPAAPRGGGGGGFHGGGGRGHGH